MKDFFIIKIVINIVKYMKTKISCKKTNEHGIPTSPRLLDIKTDAKEYIEELDYAIKNKEIQNIALLGAYGTGKSSIIKTYINSKHFKGKNKFVIVNTSSFLIFESVIEEDGEGSTIENKDDRKLSKSELNIASRIESSILKQLLHRNYQDEIPHSRMKRQIKTLSYKYIIYGYYIIALFLIHTKNPLINVLKDNIIYNSQSNYHRLITSDIISYLNIAFLISITTYLLYVIIRSLYNNLTISLSYSKNKNIELSTLEKMPFNNEILEILYFFQYNHTKVVFFEDMDRYNSDSAILVMEELKELNSIINSKKKEKDKVTFVYALKNEVFSEYTQKSKFFDYSINVMPVSTLSTSYIHLKSLFDKEPILDELLNIISGEVQDYRTILNIYNEYLLQRKKLKLRRESECSRLLAIIVFKTIEHNNYNMLIEDSEKLGLLVNEINEKRSENNQQIENEYRLFERYKWDYKLDDLKDNNSIIKLIANSSDSISISDSYLEITNGSNVEKINKNDITKILDYDYSELEVDDQLIEFLKYYKKEIVNGKIIAKYEELKEKYNKIKLDLLGEYTPVEVKSIIDNYKFVNKELVEVTIDKSIVIELLKNGFITNDYLDYISSPPNQKIISLNDYKYIRRVLNGLVANKIELEKIESIISILRKDIGRVTIKNEYMIIFLSQHKDYYFYNDLYVKVLKEIREVSYTNIDILETIKKEKLKAYINVITALVEEYNYIDELSKRTKKIFEVLPFVREIIIDILNNIDLKKNGIINDELTKIVSEDKEIHSKLELHKDIVINNMKFMGIKIKYLDSSDNLNIYISNNLYEINISNIKLLFPKEDYSKTRRMVKSYENILTTTDNKILKSLTNEILNNSNINLLDYYIVQKNPKYELDYNLNTNKIIKKRIIENNLILLRKENVNKILSDDELEERLKLSIIDELYQDNKITKMIYDISEKNNRQLLIQYIKNNHLNSDEIIAVLKKVKATPTDIDSFVDLILGKKQIKVTRADYNYLIKNIGNIEVIKKDKNIITIKKGK